MRIPTTSFLSEAFIGAQNFAHKELGEFGNLQTENKVILALPLPYTTELSRKRYD